MRVNYPIEDISTDAEAKNYFGHRNHFGKYPIGAHNAWHGGIHLEGVYKPVQCIAQGRIIAYRFTKEYKKTIINNTDHLYSNGFILIQHDYKSKEKQKMTFYSLYHHLMPESDINTQKKSVPKFLSKSSYVVTSKEGIPIEGLNARVLKSNKIDKSKKGVSVVIPKGTTVNLDPIKDSKINTGSYKRITYTDKNGKIYTDIYIYAIVGKQVKKITDNTLEIITKEDKTEDKSVLGGRVRAEGKSAAEIVKIIPYNEAIEIDEKVKGSWKKLKDGTGFIHKSGFTTKNIFDDSKGKIDEIVACDIPIKAGTTIGYTGNFGFEGYQGYKATHLEVFATDDVCEFLSNEKKDGKEELYFTNIKVGTKLKTSLSYKVDIKANTPIKVLNIEGDYTQIKITNIEGVVKKSLLGGYKSATGGSYYAISSNNVSKLNPSFNNALPSDLKKLYWVSRCDSSGKNLTKSEENKKIADAKKGNKTYTPYRKVTYKPKNNGTYWIEKTALTKIQEPEKGIESWTFFPSYLQEEQKKKNAIPRDPKTGEKTTLNTDICKAYIELPMSKEEEITVLDGEEKLVDLRKFKKATDNNKEVWIKIVLDKVKIPRRIIKGWIKEKDLDIFSAYNWKKFGFKDLDAGNEYIYSVKDLREATDNTAFVTQVWDSVDKDGNKVLDIMELNRAFNKPEIAHKLSRLVCKHKNEWSYKMSELKSEIKELYDFGIQMEEDGDRKQKLETKRDDRLAKMETKIKDLMWWDEASKLTYTKPVEPVEPTPKPKYDFGVDPEPQQATPIKDTPQKDVVPLATKTTAPQPDTNPAGGEPVETKKEEKDQPPKRMFPTTNIVYHFHPIAWVTQMKRVFGGAGNCLCTRKLKEEDVRLMVKRLTGKVKLWSGSKQSCEIEDKSFASFTDELNKMFEKHGFNTCIEKISFLAQAAHETGGFQQNKEEKSKYNSSISTYKGRGLIQITGSDDGTGYYNDAGLYKKYADFVGNQNIISDPDIIAKNLHYAVDVGGWFFKIKKVPKWNKKWAKYDALRVQKAKYFNDGLGKNLLELAPFINKKEKYFWLQSKILNGYQKHDTLKNHPNGWNDRLEAFMKLKSVFNFGTTCINNFEKINIEKRAPWMKIAIEEAEKSAGCHEGKEPLLTMGTNYLKFSGNNHSPDDDVNGQWCASYLSWCINKSGFDVHKDKWKRANSQEFRKSANKGEIYKKIEEPIFGALAIYTKHKDSNHGHIGFVAGKTKRGKLLLLGGNQGDTIRTSAYGLKTKTKYLNGFYIPKSYNVTEKDYLTDDEKNYSSSSELNYKLGIYTKNKNGTDKTS